MNETAQCGKAMPTGSPFIETDDVCLEDPNLMAMMTEVTNPNQTPQLDSEL